MKKHTYGNKGFTLVELIIVLVVLAILAAILVPALLGHIDRAREQQDILDGHNILTATQSELTRLYGLNKDQDSGTVIPGFKDDRTTNSNADVNGAKTEFAKNILALSETKPYILVVGLGSTALYMGEEDQRKCYTVYTAMYMKTEKSTPVYYYGDEWGQLYPTDKRIKVVTKKYNNELVKQANYHNKTGVWLQYYILANGNGKYNEATIWDFLQKKSDFQKP
ncbi:MAG: type II secretion system protein [Lachnospiraceae bacterium]|nr:type II secretion system protein [Lachnospiraceae bacterium]